MSIAVAVRKGGEIILAADGQSNFGGLRVPTDNHKADKIRRVGEAYLATTGWGIYENILEDYLRRRRRAASLRTKEDIFAFFLDLWKELHERYSLVNDQCADDDDGSPFGDLDASFLVTSPAGIFLVSSDMSVTAFEKYFAVGSGGDFSLGALHALYDGPLGAEDLARRAVDAAIAFNTSCGGEAEIRRIKL